MGRFTVRLPDTLHHELEERAEREGVSLNQFIVYTLTSKITPTYTIQVLPDAATDRQRERLDALVQRLGQLPPAAMQDFLESRTLDEPEDEATASLIADVQAKITA